MPLMSVAFSLDVYVIRSETRSNSIVPRPGHRGQDADSGANGSFQLYRASRAPNFSSFTRRISQFAPSHAFLLNVN